MLLFKKSKEMRIHYMFDRMYTLYSAVCDKARGDN